MVVPSSYGNLSGFVNRDSSCRRSHSVRSRGLSRRGRSQRPLRPDTAKGPLDAGAFPAFAPLLQASQGYARLSGCRFRGRSFDDLRQPSPAIPSQGVGLCPDQRDASKAEVAPVGREFAAKLQEGEPALLQELGSASSLVLEEGVRSSMVATCRRLDVWPPRVSLLDAGIESCERGSATLTMIAWQLYLDDSSRHGGQIRHADVSAVQVARTAAFIADFGHAVGIAEPAMPAPVMARFQDFTALVASWEEEEEQQSEEGNAQRSPRFKVFLPSMSLMTTVKCALNASATVAFNALELRACKRRRVLRDHQMQVV